MEKEAIQKGTGLNVLVKSESDFSRSKVFGSIGAGLLPRENFMVADPFVIKDQGSFDFCTGFGATAVTEDQEQVEMCPLWQFAQIKRLMGEYASWGADLRQAGLSLCKVGSLPKVKSPYGMDRNRDFLANWENWPKELEAYAEPHKKKTMFFVDGPHDTFDNIVMTLWMKRGQKCSVLAGINWRYSWNNAEGGVVPQKGWENDKGEGHCINFKGVKYIDGIPYLVAQNSWGIGMGDRGMFYFPREVINTECAPYGQITFEDMDKETAKYFLLHNIKMTDSRFKTFIKVLISTIKYILK